MAGAPASRTARCPVVRTSSCTGGTRKPLRMTTKASPSASPLSTAGVTPGVAGTRFVVRQPSASRRARSTRKASPLRSGSATASRVTWKLPKASTTSPGRAAYTTSNLPSPASGTATTLSAGTVRPSRSAGAASCANRCVALAAKAILSLGGSGSARTWPSAVTRCSAKVE